MQSNLEIIDEVIEPKNCKYKREMEEIYRSIKKKKLFETNSEINEKCLKIAQLWKKY